MESTISKSNSKPQSQPAVWNLTHESNPYFVGRADAMKSLERGFSKVGAGKKPQILYGTGGTGKTSVAVEYCYEHQDQYDIVWWVRGETQAMIAADLARLGARLSGSGSIQEWSRQASQAALRELARRDRWLLIFDNATREKDLLPYLPKGAGHVLITTSNTSWGTLGTTIPILPWTPLDSMDFLRKRLGQPKDELVAEKLTVALGHLPLAIEQAAACIEQTKTSMTDYLKDFEKLWTELFGFGRPAGNYPVAAAMAWELSFRQIEFVDVPAASLLNLCAFLAAEEIPLRMILDAADNLPENLVLAGADPVRFSECLNTIRNFSLARTTERSLAMHGVISALAQDRLSDQEREKWCSSAVIVASTSFRYDSQDPRTWPACAESLPHALAAAFNAQRLGVVPAVAADLLSRAGRFLLKQAQYTEARDVLETALNLVKTAFGERSPQAADIANNLGRACHRMGDLTDASTLFESAMSIDLDAYGPNDPHRATVANNLGMAQVARGQPNAARQSFEWALNIYQKRYGPEHPKVASVMNNLGFVLAQLDERDTARNSFRKALEISEATYGAGHPQVACIAVNLGSVLRLQQEFDEARQLYDRALLIDENALGAHHPSVARDLSRLGQLLYDQADYAGAVSNLERALLICESAYGVDHRKTATCLADLGKALAKDGQAVRSEECLTRAAAITGKTVQLDEAVNLGDEELIARD
jgi:tetratricopeptide (TPR) repeat protein